MLLLVCGLDLTLPSLSPLSGKMVKSIEDLWRTVPNPDMPHFLLCYPQFFAYGLDNPVVSRQCHAQHWQQVSTFCEIKTNSYLHVAHQAVSINLLLVSLAGKLAFQSVPLIAANPFGCHDSTCPSQDIASDLSLMDHNYTTSCPHQKLDLIIEFPLQTRHILLKLFWRWASFCMIFQIFAGLCLVFPFRNCW